MIAAAISLHLPILPLDKLMSILLKVAPSACTIPLLALSFSFLAHICTNEINLGLFFNRKNLSGIYSVLCQINTFNRYSFHLYLLISVEICKDVSFHAGHSEDVELVSCKPVWVQMGQPEDSEPVYID
jgi:hypothetical protein